MKKLNLLKSMMLLCMLMVGMGAWADSVNFTLGSGKNITSNEGATKNGITITATDGTSTPNNWNNTTHARIQAGATLVITPTLVLQFQA